MHVIDQIKKLKFQDVGIGIYAIFLMVIPFISQQKKLPYGWDIPKIELFLWFTLVLTFAVVGHKIYLLIQNPKIEKKSVLNLFGYGVLIILPLLSSILFRFGKFQMNNYENSFYVLLQDVLPFISDNMGIWGNDFRHTGAIVILFLILNAFLLKDLINKKNIQFIFLAIIIPALVQSVLAIQQYADLYQNNYEELTSGTYIYGTYGQTNFYAGTLLVAIGLLTFYIEKFKLDTKRLVLILGGLLLLIFGIFISFSTWAIITVFIGILFYSMMKINWKVVFSDKNKLIIFRILSPILGLLGIFLFYRIFFSNFRMIVWRRLIDTFILTINGFQDFLYLLIGTGYDQLGEFIYSEYRFTDLYLDRPHNIFLYILTSSGIVGLGLFVYLLVKIYKKYLKFKSDPIIFAAFFALVLYLTRSFVHTNSIVNLLYLSVLISIFFSGTAKSLEKGSS